MKRTVILLMVFWSIFLGEAHSQEDGPLMMGVELGYTLGGMIFGVAAGGIVWLTDPAGPTPIRDIIRDGAVVGTFFGAFAGFYLLNNAVLLPGEQPTFQNLEDLVGQADYSPPTRMSLEGRPLSKYQKPGFSLTLINFNF